MTLSLDNVKEAKTSSETSTSSMTIQALSPEIPSKFGGFRQITIGENHYNVDSRKVINANFFKAGCLADVTLVSGKRKDGSEGTFINSVVINLPAGVMSSQR